MSLLGLLIYVFIAYFLSRHRKKVNYMQGYVTLGTLLDLLVLGRGALG